MMEALGDEGTRRHLSRLIAGWLRDAGYTDTLAALQRECADADEPRSGLTDLLRALEALDVSKRPTEIARRSVLDLECPAHLPHRVSTTLETVHATNILSITSHRLPRRQFDTVSAEYVDGLDPCIVTSAADRTVKFTAVASWQVIELFEPGGGPFLHIAFHPSRPEQMALASMTGEVVIIDLLTRDVLHRVRQHSKYAVRLAYSSDGRYLASISYDKTLKVVETETMATVWSTTFATNPEGLLFVPGGHLVLSRRESSHLMVVDPTDWSMRHVNLNDHDDSHVSFSILDICLHPSAAYLSLQTDTQNARILLFPLDAASRPTHISESVISKTLYTFAEQSEYSLPRHAWLPDGSAVAVTSDAGLVRVVDIAHGLVRSTIRAHGEAAPGAAAERLGGLAGRMGSGSSVVRDVCCLTTPDGTVAVCSVGFDRTIRISLGDSPAFTS